MNVCTNLKPKKVFQFFEEICSIPHGSGNTRAISNYCVKFAKERGLNYHQDALNNVIIWKDATVGYEEAPVVIIQGHLDMVCEKDSDREIDFTKEGLSLFVEGDFLKARGTTLGGDDGIAVAYALAILDSSELDHPPLEIVFTVDEETGMIGAAAIDTSMLKGTRLLNIDSDDEGIFYTSCAGGLRANCRLPVDYTKQTGKSFCLMVHELTGGHSGTEIHKERANGIILLGRILAKLRESMAFSMESLSGGQEDNVIPSKAFATIVLEQAQEVTLHKEIARLADILKQEYKFADPNLTISCEEKQQGTFFVLDEKSAAKVLLFLRTVPYGVQNTSMAIPGLVETSLNPGIMELTKEYFKLAFAIRSSVTSRKHDLSSRLSALTEYLGGSMVSSSDYPAWEYQEESQLRDLVLSAYQDLFGKEPKILAIHAGLECGLFCGKIPDLDCISFGPANYDIHTPQERLSISSTERTWNLIIEFLRRAKQ